MIVEIFETISRMLRILETIANEATTEATDADQLDR